MGHVSRSLLLAVLPFLVLAGSGCKGEPAGNDAGPPLMCSVASDCTRSEIDHEIRSSADCICLVGCPFVIMNVTTANRRMAQYQARCTPGRDAQGQPCPIDDCVLPPPLDCVGELCVSASHD